MYLEFYRVKKVFQVGFVYYFVRNLLCKVVYNVDVFIVNFVVIIVNFVGEIVNIDKW